MCWCLLTLPSFLVCSRATLVSTSEACLPPTTSPALLPACVPQPNTWCLRTPDGTRGRRDLKREARLLDVTVHKVGKEKDQTPKQSSDVCTQTHAVTTQPATLPSRQARAVGAPSAERGASPVKIRALQIFVGIFSQQFQQI